jgi:thiol-disulfide isomerase/thioredoxin
MESNFKYVEIGEVEEGDDGNFKDVNTPHQTSEKIKDLIHDVESNKDVFLFVFMEGCGPCNMTKPEWKKLEKLNQDGAVVALLNQKLLYQKEYKDQDENKKLLSLIGPEPSGFPTLRYIKGKKHHPDYESSRTKEAFEKWIREKTDMNMDMKGGKRLNKQVGWKKGGKTRKTRKTRKMRLGQRAGKWSMKYKKSINCKKPKGFSQKQHCKYGRKRWSKK